MVILGDQLNRSSAAFDGFDQDHDVVWMAEVPAEAEHVWSHKARIALFLAAMRHFRDGLVRDGFKVDYREMGESATLLSELQDAVKRHRPKKVIVVEPGEWRLADDFKALGDRLEVRADRHFLCSVEEFRQHAKGRKQLRMEYFYREMRRRHGYLMEADQPVDRKSVV